MTEDDLWKARRGLDAEQALRLALERTAELREEIQALRMANLGLLSFLKTTQVLDPDLFEDYFKGLRDSFPPETHPGRAWDLCRAEITRFLEEDGQGQRPHLQVIEGGRRDDL